MGCLRLTYWNKVDIPSYRDDLKNTSKTEYTLIFEIGGNRLAITTCLSPYVFTANSALQYIDPDGKELLHGKYILQKRTF